VYEEARLHLARTTPDCIDRRLKLGKKDATFVGLVPSSRSTESFAWSTSITSRERIAAVGDPSVNRPLRHDPAAQVPKPF
jgi:hypothetical protein